MGRFSAGPHEITFLTLAAAARLSPIGNFAASAQLAPENEEYHPEVIRRFSSAVLVYESEVADLNMAEKLFGRAVVVFLRGAFSASTRAGRVT